MYECAQGLPSHCVGDIPNDLANEDALTHFLVYLQPLEGPGSDNMSRKRCIPTVALLAVSRGEPHRFQTGWSRHSRSTTGFHGVIAILDKSTMLIAEITESLSFLTKIRSSFREIPFHYCCCEDTNGVEKR